jgi:hypothetical protein
MSWLHFLVSKDGFVFLTRSIKGKVNNNTKHVWNVGSINESEENGQLYLNYVCLFDLGMFYFNVIVDLEIDLLDLLSKLKLKDNNEQLATNDTINDFLDILEVWWQRIQSSWLKWYRKYVLAIEHVM